MSLGIFKTPEQKWKFIALYINKGWKAAFAYADSVRTTAGRSDGAPE